MKLSLVTAIAIYGNGYKTFISDNGYIKYKIKEK